MNHQFMQSPLYLEPNTNGPHINNVNNSLHNLNLNHPLNNSSNSNYSYNSNNYNSSNNNYNNNNNNNNNNSHQIHNSYQNYESYNENCNNSNNNNLNNINNNSNINNNNYSHNNINNNYNNSNNTLKIPPLPIIGQPSSTSPNGIGNSGLGLNNTNKLFSKLDLSKVPNSYQLTHNSSMPNSPTSSNISPSTPTSMALNLNSLKSILDSPPAAPATSASSSSNDHSNGIVHHINLHSGGVNHNGVVMNSLNLNNIGQNANNNSNNSSGNQPPTPSSSSFNIPLLQLKQLQGQSPPNNTTTTTTTNHQIPIINTPEIHHQRSNPPSATNSPRYYIPSQQQESSVENSPFTTPLSSPRGPISPRAASNSSLLNNQSNIRVEEQWKKIEYYVNDLSHFIYDCIRSKDFSNLSELKDKIEEVVNTSKEIEIIHSIAKSLPPQTRARKKRSTKAEKLQKDLIGIKRTYVTTPKSKGTYCIFCGTMETPEWRKGPGGHKTLCNACGLHYAKNIKKENQNNNNSPNPQSSPNSNIGNNNNNSNSNNESAMSVSKLISDN
ncbi:hypothetical protein DICPUDRAFT_51958 [Dictyostelium purpureum]|uniref:GATA-type domain-containing protein n=1 Tax=Dictyostelium purpureum TaxID=5786 RepID=F1A6E4_DICPU|nr:uncharacterized protein DICPUDRAFT_51958 [Dictyostelium purpureum]EGC28236.1 hypothetical protein DICPUDRAFT_51958 [Dictyostelium purpureum]|eukprot:XP_003295238.1 hypothetical protein DICPUDRAFT_51958 [Dictyostelium purpureum]